MKMLLPIIALMLVGCKTSGEQSVLGSYEWKTPPSASAAITLEKLKIRPYGVMEYEGRAKPSGKWKIVDGIIEIRFHWRGVTTQQFFKIEGSNKLLLFRSKFDGGQYEQVTEHDPPRPFNRVVKKRKSFCP